MIKFKSRVVALAVALAAVLASGYAFAAPIVIDYETVGFDNSYDEDGFNTSVDFGNFQPTGGSAGSSKGFYAGFAGQTVTVKALSGTAFSLASIDFALGAAVSFDVSGLLSDGSTVNKTIWGSQGTLSGGQGGVFPYRTYLFDSSFGNIVSFSFVQGFIDISQGINTTRAMDRVVLDEALTASVPEPSSVALVCVALAGLGFGRLRKV